MPHRFLDPGLRAHLLDQIRPKPGVALRRSGGILGMAAIWWLADPELRRLVFWHKGRHSSSILVGVLCVPVIVGPFLLHSFHVLLAARRGEERYRLRCSDALADLGGIADGEPVSDVGWPLLVFTIWQGNIAALVRTRYGLLAARATHGLAVAVLASGQSYLMAGLGSASLCMESQNDSGCDIPHNKNCPSRGVRRL